MSGIRGVGDSSAGRGNGKDGGAHRSSRSPPSPSPSPSPSRSRSLSLSTSSQQQQQSQSQSQTQRHRSEISAMGNITNNNNTNNNERGIQPSEKDTRVHDSSLSPSSTSAATAAASLSVPIVTSHTNTNTRSSVYAPLPLDAIERGFLALMKELNRQGDEYLPLRRLYDTLHRALLKTSESEKRIADKNVQLETTSVENARKIATALQLAKQDQEEISSLRSEIEKAWKQVDAARENERVARESIQVLRNEVAELAQQVESGAHQMRGNEEQVRELIRSRRQLLSDHAMTTSKMLQLRRHHAERQALANEATKQSEELAEELRRLQDDYDNLQMAFDEVHQEREDLDARADLLHNSIDAQTAESEKLRVLIEARGTAGQRLGGDLTELQASLAQAEQRAELVQRTLTAETERLRTIEATVQRQEQRLPEKEKILAAKQQDVQRQEHKLSALHKKITARKDAIQQLLDEKERLNGLTENHQRDVLELADELHNATVELQRLDRALKDAVQVKAQLRGATVQQEQARVEEEGVQFMEKGKNRHLERALDAERAANESKRKEVYVLQQTKEKHTQANQRSVRDFQQTKEQLRQTNRTLQSVADHVKRNEAKLSSQTTTYEQVRQDRAAQHKQLEEAERELGQWREECTTTEGSVEHYKGLLAREEQHFGEALEAKIRVEQDIVAATHRLQILRENRAQVSARMDTLQHEAEHLDRIISECDREKSVQKTKLTTLFNERNVLATQLLRRDEELTLLHAKVKLQQSFIQKAREENRRLVNDLMERAATLHELRIKFRLALVRLQQHETVRQQHLQAEMRYWQERHKGRALAEELANPKNVHRWSPAAGFDPEHMDEILKAQLLQKQLAEKLKDVAERQEELNAVEKEYNEVQTRLARLPGPEAAEDLHDLDVQLKERQEQLRVMKDEAERLDRRVEVQQEDVNAIQHTLLDTKQKLFAEKHKNGLLIRERELRSELDEQKWWNAAAAAGGGVGGSGAAALGTAALKASSSTAPAHTASRGGRHIRSNNVKNHSSSTGTSSRAGGTGTGAAPPPSSSSSGGTGTGTPQPRRFAGGGFAITR